MKATNTALALEISQIKATLSKANLPAVMRANLQSLLAAKLSK